MTHHVQGTALNDGAKTNKCTLKVDPTPKWERREVTRTSHVTKSAGIKIAGECWSPGVACHTSLPNTLRFISKYSKHKDK